MIVYTCKDTFEDMMTCLYDAWASREGHKNIRLQTEPLGNLELFCEYRHVEKNLDKSKKVIRSIQSKISVSAFHQIFRCAMSDLPDKLDRIYRFLLLGFSYPKDVLSMLQHPYVMALFEASRKVANETHLFREFVRFQALPNHILVAHIEPKSNVLPLLYPAFDDRLPSENWMIIDDNRQTAAVHEADQPTYLTELTTEELAQLLHSEEMNDQYTDLWKSFFSTIMIKERKNPVCQRNHLPLWYRKHMTEMKT